MINQRCVYEHNQTSDIVFRIPLCEYQDANSIICYSFWKLVDRTPNQIKDSTGNKQQFLFHAKGCWGGEDQSLCKNKLFNNSLLFCCCKGEFCNRDLTPQHCLKEIYSSPTHQININLFDWSTISNHTINLICLIVLLIVIPIIMFCLFKFLRKQKCRQLNAEEIPRSNWNKELERLLTDHNQIEIIKYQTRGRYGNIYKARLIDDKKESIIVAIKVFQMEDYESFKNELKIFKLPDFKHENLLEFIKAEVRTGSLLNTTEYWLITKYMENGSLEEYLDDHLLNESQIITISNDIANGLAFLHGKSTRQIAHRDFKSGNVLLNAQLRACIADFNLALVFYNHKLESDTLNQVGTLRYFSPELLDGAINFSGDSLLKVDIYACALVFWEILSRHIELQDQNQEKDYKLPFELELGTMPSISELRNYVLIQQRRPVIESHWRSNSFLETFCKIIEDCWEFDAEKRITSACLLERLKFSRAKSDQELISNDADFCHV